MKFLFSIVILLAFSANQYEAVPRHETSEDEYLQSIFNAVYSPKAVECESSSVCYKDFGCFSLDGPMGHTLALPQSPEHIKTKFYAYKPTSEDDEFTIDAYDNKTFNFVDSSKRLAIIIHGYTSYPDVDILTSLRHSMLENAKEIGTIIMVDWRIGAKGPLYNQASANTELVGRQTAHLVNEIIKNNRIKPSQVYLIGFSLGAQVAGHAGKWSQSEYKWKFDRITGLDAAAPLFEGHDGSYLTKEDATFVDGIHTSIGNNILAAELGFTSAYAHIDFYPNGGKKQPMCHLGSGITCKHRAAVRYYDASLTAPCKFDGHSCDSYEDYEHGRCVPSQTVLGYRTDRDAAQGKMFLDTSDKYPFCDEN